MTWTPEPDQKPKRCDICEHGVHPPGRCLALGIARRCMCEPWMTRDRLDAATLERDRGQTLQGGRGGRDVDDA